MVDSYRKFTEQDFKNFAESLTKLGVKISNIDFPYFDIETEHGKQTLKYVWLHR